MSEYSFGWGLQFCMSWLDKSLINSMSSGYILLPPFQNKLPVLKYAHYGRIFCYNTMQIFTNWICILEQMKYVIKQYVHSQYS